MKTMAMESEDNRLLMLAIATLGKLANVCKDHKQFENIDIFKLLLDILEEIRLRYAWIRICIILYTYMH